MSQIRKVKFWIQGWPVMSDKGGIPFYLMPVSPMNHFCGVLEGLRSHPSS